MPKPRIASSSRASLVLLVCLLVPACGGISLSRASAVAVEHTSVGLKELRDHVETEHQARRISDDELNTWKRRLGRIARVGNALKTALLKGDGQDAATQVGALFDMIDTLTKEQVKKLPPGVQTNVRISIEVVRSALLVIAALTGATPPPPDLSDLEISGGPSDADFQPVYFGRMAAARYADGS